MATVEVRRLPDGQWAWTYREQDVVLYSNDVYETAEEAEKSARSAYPDVPITRTIAESAPESGTPKGRLTFLLMVWALWRHKLRKR